MSNLSSIVENLNKKKQELEKQNQDLHDRVEAHRSTISVINMSNEKIKGDLKECNNKLTKSNNDLKFCNEYKTDITKRTQELLVGKENQTKKDFKTFLKLINNMFEDYEKVGSFRLPKRECDKSSIVQVVSQDQKPFEQLNKSESKPLDIFEGEWSLLDEFEIIYAEIKIDEKGYLNMKDVYDDSILAENMFMDEKHKNRIIFDEKLNSYILETYYRNRDNKIKSTEYDIEIKDKDGEKTIKLFNGPGGLTFVLKNVSKHEIKNKEYIKKWIIYDSNGNETKYYFDVKKDGKIQSNFKFPFKKIILDDQKNQLIFYKNIKDEYSNDIIDVKKLQLEYKNNILNVYDITSPAGYIIGATKKLVFSLRKPVLDKKDNSLSNELWYLYTVSYEEDLLGPSELSYGYKKEKEVLNYTKYKCKIVDGNMLLDSKISSSDKKKFPMFEIFEKSPFFDIKTSTISIEEKIKNDYFDVKIVKIPFFYDKYAKEDSKSSIIIYDPTTYSNLPFRTNKKLFILKTFEKTIYDFDIKFFSNKNWNIFINDDKSYLLYLDGRKQIEDKYKYYMDKNKKIPINTVRIEQNGNISLSRDIKVNFISGKFTNDTFNMNIVDEKGDYKEYILPIKKEDKDIYSLITVYKTLYSSSKQNLPSITAEKAKEAKDTYKDVYFRLLYIK